MRNVISIEMQKNKKSNTKSDGLYSLDKTRAMTRCQGTKRKIANHSTTSLSVPLTDDIDVIFDDISSSQNLSEFQ